jgi:hypothetical protein
MNVIRHLVPSLLAVAAATAGEAAPVEVGIADGQTLAAHWKASIYAKVLADPSAAALRQQLDEQLAKATAELGFDPLAALVASKGFRARFLGMLAPEEPKLTVQVDLGTFAQPLMAAWGKRPGAEKAQVAGADEALTWPGESTPGTVARFGAILAAAAGQPPALGPVAPIDGDVVAVVDAKRLVEAVRPGIPPEDIAEFEETVAAMGRYLAVWTYRGNLVPEGWKETLVAGIGSPGAKPVDRALLGRLPATTMLVGAVGLDGSVFWAAERANLLDVIDRQTHPDAPLGAAATEAEINAQLKEFGLSCDLAGLCAGLSGTWALSISQSAPFPAGTLIAPRSPVTDELVGLLVAQVQGQLPAEGASVILPLDGMPVPLSLVRDSKAWLLTSDAMLAGSFAGGQPGGWADTAAAKTALAKAPADAFFLGASDTPAVLRTVHGLLGMFLNMAGDMPMDQKRAILEGLQRAAAAVSTGYAYCASDGKRTTWESRGIIGIGVFPVIGGIGALLSPKAEPIELIEPEIEVQTLPEPQPEAEPAPAAP